MTLPFEPQPIEQLRARLKHALTRVWDADAIVASIDAGRQADRPHDHREHVFDFSVASNRLRTIVSIDRCACHGHRLHVSASSNAGIPDENRVREFLGQLGLLGISPVWRGVSPDRVLHLYFPWDGAPAFSGEEMQCILCGQRQRSDPATSSGWGVFMVQDLGRIYACAAEIPRSDAGAAAAQRFWERLKNAIAIRRAGPVEMPTAGRSQAECRRPGVN